MYEGLVLAQFNDDDRPVIADENSQFYDYLDCPNSEANPCTGTVSQFVTVFFGGKFEKSHTLQDILVLALFLVAARVLTFFALKHFNFSAI